MNVQFDVYRGTCALLCIITPRVMLVQDCYPAKLLQEWDNWKNNHDCENERPGRLPSSNIKVLS